MATLDSETLDALNALLEDTRASVEIEVALADGTTDLREQDTLTAMGGEEVLACCALRERLTLAGAPVTWRVGGIVFHILNTERYDERLRAFARHQAAICERAQALLAAISDHPTVRLLQDLYDSHLLSARWAELRANQFAATRLLDFTVPASVRIGAAHLLADNTLADSACLIVPATSSLSADAEANNTSDASLETGDPTTPQPQREMHSAQAPARHNGHTLPHDSAATGEAPHDGDYTTEPDGAPRQE